MAESIVEGWLRSLNLVHYTQAFLDNGYDDLEVCKQVGEEDLDAIGVTKKEHRDKLIRAVRILKEEGGTAVYFTLEDDASPVDGENTYEETGLVFADLGPAPASPPSGFPPGEEGYDAGRRALLAYPKLQLKHILRDKLVADEVDLANPPYTTNEHTLCQSSLTALAVKYAGDLSTYFADVWDRLEELWKLSRESDTFQLVCRSPMHSIYGGSSLYGFSPRGAPPPLPSCPPPSTSHVDRNPELPLSPHVYGQDNYIAIDGDLRDNAQTDVKRSSSLGKFLRNIGIRKSGKKNSYKQHSDPSSGVATRWTPGCYDPNAPRMWPVLYEHPQYIWDPVASDITMSDEDRIALMVMVKEGKISTETALEVVKRFEDEHRGENVKENRLDSPSIKKSGKDKKKKGLGKPTKSHSAVYSDEAIKCHVCQHLMLHQDYEVPIPPPPPDGQPLYECCRHRRVHSVGHIDFPAHLHSPPFARAFSCSPTRSGVPQPPTSSPGSGGPPGGNRLYSPILSQAPRVPPSGLPPGVEHLRERLSGKPQIFLHKTPSRTSLLSSESDHSMECTSHGAPLRPDLVTMRSGDNENYCSTNSTVSMSSDNSPAQGRRKHDSGVRTKPHRIYRSTSYSTGDDGISSENDDHEDAHLLGAVSRDVCRNGGKLSGRLRDMKNKVLKGREGHQGECESNGAVPTVYRPPLRRENSLGGAKTTGCHYQAPPNTSTFQVHQANRQPIYTQGQERPPMYTQGPDRQPMYAPGAERPPMYAHGAERPPAYAHERPMYMAGPVIGRAQVHTDFDSQGHPDFLNLKRGDVISILSMGHSGIWRGVLKGRVGHFRFCYVNVLGDDRARMQRRDKQLRRHNSRRSKPKSVEELMKRIGLEHLTSLFMLNGYEMLETFSELDEDDLNTLNISDPEQRAKLLTAAELLNSCHAYDAADGCQGRSDQSGSGANSSDTPSSLSPATITPADAAAPARTGNSSRDSGCYASNEQLMLKDAQKPHSSQQAKVVTTPSGPQPKVPAGPVRSDSAGHMCGMCGKPRQQGQSPQREDEGMETDRSDKDYTEEDKEVFAITNGYLHEKSPQDKTAVKNSSKKMSGYCKHCVQSQTKPKSSSRGTPKDSANSSLTSDTSASTTTSSVNSPPNPNLQCSVYGGSGTQTRRKVKPVPPPRAPGTEITTSDYARGMYAAQNQRREISAATLYGRHHITMPASQLPLSMYYPERIASPHGTLPGRGHHQVAPPEPIYGQVTIKNVSRSLIPLVSTKLSAEKIDLSEEPYSSELGECGIPPLLIQRYAEELRQDITSVALVLEQVRLYHLQNHQRNSVANEKLGEHCSTAVDLKIASIEDFFTSIGLPMYIDALYEKGCCTIQLLLNTAEPDLDRITGADSRHLKRMVHAIDWVREKLQSPVRSPKSPTKSVPSSSTKQTSLRDRV